MESPKDMSEQQIILGDCLEKLVGAIGKTYTIGQEGYCMNRKTGKKLVFTPDRKGYLKARIWCPELSKNKDRRIPMRLHRLIGMFFLQEFNPKLQINHKNGIKTDNRVQNLEMVNNSQNALHGWRLSGSTKRKKLLNSRRDEKGRFGKNRLSQTMLF